MTDEIPSDLGRYDQGQRDNRKKDTLKHFVRLQQEEIFSYLLNKRIIAEHMQLTETAPIVAVTLLQSRYGDINF